MEKVRVTTSVGTKDMFRFQLYHTYCGTSGFFLCLLAIVAAADLIGNFSNMEMGTKVLCAIMILWVIVINPLTLYSRSKKQAESAELYKEPLDAEFSEEGMTLYQGENTGLIEWKEISKIVFQKKLIIFYMGKVRAHLLPLEQIPEQADDVVKAIRTFAVGVKLAGNKKMRRK